MTPERIARLRQVLACRQPDLTVVTDFVHKQRNLSAVVRNCDAAGVMRVHAVLGEADYQAFRGTAMGSQHWVEVVRHRELAVALDTLLAQRDDRVWWQGRKGEHLASSLNAAVAALQEETGEIDPGRWYLAGLQRVGLSHELSSAVPGLGTLLDYPEQAWGGGSSTVGRARSRYDSPNRIRSGATVRVVAEMSTPITARAIIPGGQSGYPFSPHYFDQFPEWLAGSLDSLAADPGEIGGDTLMLKPETAQ